MHSIVKDWGPVILWAALIFYSSTDTFSAQNTSLIVGPLVLWVFPNISSEELEIFYHTTRKFAHWAEYFIFALLLMRAFRVQKSNESGRQRTGRALVIVLIYALSDEFHQMFVPSRSPLLSDVILDVFGGVCGVMVYSYVK